MTLSSTTSARKAATLNPVHSITRPGSSSRVLRAMAQMYRGVLGRKLPVDEADSSTIMFTYTA